MFSSNCTADVVSLDSTLVFFTHAALNGVILKCVYRKWARKVEDDIPDNLPNPYGRGFTIWVYGRHSDHADDQVTRRSRTGFF